MGFRLVRDAGTNAGMAGQKAGATVRGVFPT